MCVAAAWLDCACIVFGLKSVCAASAVWNVVFVFFLLFVRCVWFASHVCIVCVLVLLIGLVCVLFLVLGIVSVLLLLFGLCVSFVFGLCVFCFRLFVLIACALFWFVRIVCVWELFFRVCVLFLFGLCVIYF